MKQEHTRFITGLLSNPKLSLAQRDKVVELALRDLGKKWSEERIMKELQLIKELLGINTYKPFKNNGRSIIENGFATTPMTEEERDKWISDGLLTEQKVTSRFELPEMSEEEKLELQKQLSPEEYEKFFKKSKKELNDLMSKEDSDRNLLLEKNLSAAEWVERKLQKLNNPRLVLENHKLKNSSKTIPEINANPKHVADFMALFNKREGFKYLTHDYDENNNFDIDYFLISVNKVFINETKKLKIPKSLWRIVQQFAFDSKQSEWTSISEDYKKPVPISTGWATKELRDWSKENRLHPIRNKEYNKIINDFKRITRIESPNLEKLCDITLQEVLQKDIEKFHIQKEGLAKADFYSHVQFLKTALETIFEEVKKRSDSPAKKNITIKYERSISEDYFLRKIVIIHHNSFPTKELRLILKEWQEKGNMGKIKEKLSGYCHWSVETLIDANPIRVNILREEETNEYEKIEQNPEGFKHILTFYYK